MTTAPDRSVALPFAQPEPAPSLLVPEHREHRELVARMARLARERLAPRAADYDREPRFPREDFDDLTAAGFHAATVPVEQGGLGLGPLHGAAYTLWMLTKEIAKADLSLARCWEGHTNSLLLLDALADDAQKARWFDGVVRGGELWVAWSGEPQAPRPGGGDRFGTTLERVDGGYRLSGTKAFATSSAAGARWAILLVHEDGPGGARHSTAAAEGLLLLACDLTDPTVRVDGSWWDPIGMRATVSHKVSFEDTFLPDSQRIGAPGRYLTEGWQTRFVPHYAASFLGAAEAAFEIARDHVTARGREGDPHLQHRVAQMAMAVDTGHLWLRHVAHLWEAGRDAEAQAAGTRARFVVEELAAETVRHAVHACGARGLLRPAPLERILRDLTIYARHDNADQILTTVGREVLGVGCDPSFYKP